MEYQTLEEMIVATAEAIRPTERLTVSQAAERYVQLDNPGAYKGPWKNSKTPYLVEPMDVLGSRDYTGMIFVGPAQCGKTDMVLNWLGYSAKCDPADMMIVQTSQAVARDFSKRRADKLFRVSPEIGAQRVPGRQNQNVFDTRFLSGMYLTLSWPTINELSGKPIPRQWVTDYDRIPDDIDGNGNCYDLLRTRGKTFKRFSMTAAESSPSRIIDDPKWTARTLHEAPPTTGILALYNRGDRRRFYWRCPQCSWKFEPSFSCMSIPPQGSKQERAEAACLACPDCGFPITEQIRSECNLTGRWIKDGLVWTREGNIEGRSFKSDIASFWLKGPAAALGDWRTLVLNYLNALEEKERTGSDDALKTTINVDQGEAYMPDSVSEIRLPENLKEKEVGCPLGSVPQNVRFLLTTIDVQKHKFVVQTHGLGEGGDICVIDRFDIRQSKRIDESAATGGQYLWVTPGSYPEDWQLLIEQVLLKTYPIHGDEQHRRMQVKMVACDSGGREGVTKNAYEFYRKLKKNDDFPDLWKRFQLVKGAPHKDAPRQAIRYPDSERKDRKAGARGEVPILLINTNLIKDQLDGMLSRRDGDQHGGLITFVEGLGDPFYVELTTEVRTAKGWQNPKNNRNESWDLLVYCIALSLSRHVGIERLSWEKPPGWAAPFERNDLVFAPAEAPEGRFVTKEKPKRSLAELAERLT